MIGSETFIIVAFRCRENSRPCSLVSAICSCRKASSARARITAPSTTSPSSTGIEPFSTVAAPSAATYSIRSSSSLSIVTLRSVERKSPSLIVATCERLSFDHAPIECGCFWRVGLHRRRRAPIRVALAQHRVDRAALHPVVGLTRLLRVVRARVVRVVGDVVARLLQLLDRRLQLRDRGADVRQLDDVGLGRLGQLAELAQRVRDALLVGQPVRELGQDPARQRDVAQLDLDARPGARTPR